MRVHDLLDFPRLEEQDGGVLRHGEEIAVHDILAAVPDDAEIVVVYNLQAHL